MSWKDKFSGGKQGDSESDAGSSTPKCPGCNGAVNGNGNCSNNSCWNANSKRHDGPNPKTP